MRKIPSLNTLIKDKQFTKKIYVYMSTKTGSDDYDSYEQNYTFTNLNPAVIKGYVHHLSPDTAFWKQYGQHIDGVKEIFVEKKYRHYFELCNRIVIDNIDYHVFKDATGSKAMITERPFDIIRVVVSRKG